MFLTVQVVMIVVMSTNRLSGVRSAGLPFLFWLVMSIYGAMKLRTLVLLAEDNNVREHIRLHEHIFIITNTVHMKYIAELKPLLEFKSLPGQLNIYFVLLCGYLH